MRQFNHFLFALAVAVAMFVAPSVCSAQGQGQKIRTIEIGMLSTTHLLFTSDLTYVDVSSPECIAAKVVDASKNMLAIKARKEFAFVTTISALEANGTMHTFYVEFNSTPRELVIDTRVLEQDDSGVVNTQIRPSQGGAVSQTTVVVQETAAADGKAKQEPDRRGRRGRNSEDVPGQVTGVNVTSSQTSNFGRGNAPTIEEVLRKERNLFHISDKSYRLEAAVENIFAYSDLTYIVISLKNNSDIGYEAGDAQFTVESKKVSSKTLTTDKSIWPKSSFGTLSCPPNTATYIGYTIPKLTLQKNEVLKIYIYEKGGSRNLFLTLDDKDVNYAVSPIE